MSKPSTSRSLLIIAVLVVLAALVIDLLDGHHVKTLGTAGLALGFLGLLADRSAPKPLWRYLAVVGFVVFISTVAYRAALHQGWIS